LLNWGAVAFLCSAAAVSGGALVIVQSYHLRETRAELAALRLRREAPPSCLVDGLRQPLGDITGLLTAERSARAALEQRSNSLSGMLAKSEHARQLAEGRAGETEAEARNERELRSSVERALGEARQAAARDKAALAARTEEIDRLEAELTRLRTAPGPSVQVPSRAVACAEAAAPSPVPVPADADPQPPKASKPKVSGRPGSRTAGQSRAPYEPTWDGTSLFRY